MEAPTECAEWPDFVALRERTRQAEQLRARRRQERLEFCRQHGLERQGKLQIARQHYRLADIAAFVKRFYPGAEGGEPLRSEMLAAEPERLDLRLSGYGSWQVQINTVERFNREIPYGILLALAEARQLNCFDRFAIMGPSTDFGLGDERQLDPMLLGVVEAPTRNARHAVYFEIGAWDAEP